MNRCDLSSVVIVVGVAAVVAAPSAVTAAAEVRTITHGAEVDLEDHLVPGKYVLFDFYADWCAPCRTLEPVLRNLADRHAVNLLVHKIDVIDWGSPVARQHALRSIPFMVLYGPDGRVVARGGAGVVLSALDRALGGGGMAAGSSRSTADAEASGPGPLLFILAVTAIAVVLLLRRRATPIAGDLGSVAPNGEDAGGTARADARMTAVWLTMMDGCLEGPFTIDQLVDLRRRSCLAADAAVRRKGETVWRTVGEVLEDQTG